MTWIHRHLFLGVFLAVLTAAFVAVTSAALWFGPRQKEVLKTVDPKFRVREVANGQDADREVGVSSRGTTPQGKGLVHYFADGRSLSNPADHNRQANWISVFNPAMTTASLEFTFYYEERSPTYMHYEVPAETVRVINLYKRKEALSNLRFGAKIVSSVPMIIQSCTAYYGRGDRKDSFTRAMDSVICSDRLSTINYYADGIVLNLENSRLKEGEWAFLLNPNKQPARVAFHAYRSDGVKKAYRIDIQPERLFSLQMHNLVEENKLFGAKFVSSVPIAIQQTRWVIEEDGLTVRATFSAMAKPWGPEGDDSEPKVTQAAQR